MKYEVRKIDPVSAGRMLVVVGLVMGLVIGFLLLIVIWFVGGITGWTGDGSGGRVVASLALGIVALVGMPIIGALVGFLGGYLGGGVYNFFSNWYGGIVIETEESEEEIV